MSDRNRKIESRIVSLIKTLDDRHRLALEAVRDLGEIIEKLIVDEVSNEYWELLRDEFFKRSEGTLNKYHRIFLNWDLIVKRKLTNLPYTSVIDEIATSRSVESKKAYSKYEIQVSPDEKAEISSSMTTKQAKDLLLHHARLFLSRGVKR